MVKYSLELKLMIVQDYLKGGGGYGYLADKYGIADKWQVKRWGGIYQDMGIYDEVSEVANHGYGLTLFDKNGDRADLYSSEIEEFITPRRVVDDITCKAAVRAGAEFWGDFDARELIMKKGAVKGVKGVYRGQVVDVYADVVVIASGSHSMLARQIGIYKENPDFIHYAARGYFENIGEMKKEHIEAHYIEELAPNGYIWLCPIGEGRANVGVFASEATLQKSNRKLEEWIDYWAKNTERGKERLGNAKQIGKIQGWRIPTSPSIEKNYAAGAVVIGDSANTVDSWQGEGYVQAVTAGAVVGQFLPAVIVNGDFSEEALAPFQAAVGAQLNAFLMQSVLLRKYLFTTPENVVSAFDYFRAQPEYSNIPIFDAFAMYFKNVAKLDI